MKCGFILVIGISTCAFAGCTSERRQTVVETHTLAGTPHLPLGDMETLFSPGKWARLRDLEYERYVTIEAEIQSDGTVKLGRVIESFPDASWIGSARNFGQKVELRADGLGSHLNPRAEIVVVLFKPVLEGNLVLVFGRQVEEPAVGMTKRAMYINTFIY